MKRFASLATLLLLVVLCVPASSHASTTAACAQPSCVFLPITRNVPPVMVANLWSTHTRNPKVVHYGGFVVTTGNQPVSDAIIEVAFYDGNNQVIGAWSGTTVLTTTLPGQENPFEIFTSEQPGFNPAIRSRDVRVISWSLGNPRSDRALTVLNIVPEEFLDVRIRVHADLRNDSGVPLTNVRMVAWGNEQPQIIIAQPVVDSLAPGATISGAVDIYGGYLGDPPHVSAQGTPAP